MIFHEGSGTLIDNLGWIDAGSLWVSNARTRGVTLVPTGDASSLSLRAGANGMFRVVHHGRRQGWISVRPFAEPRLELASLHWHADEAQFRGDDTVWANVEKAAVVRSLQQTRLVVIDAPSRRVISLNQSWFNADSYDVGYQNISDCLFLPASNAVVVSIQRSSNLVVLDVAANRPTSQIRLADRIGNPDPIPISPTKFLSCDYDTVCVVDSLTGEVRCSRPLQPPVGGQDMRFVGEVSQRADKLAVARPYSNDAMLIDLATFQILSWAQFSVQPLSICMTSNRDVVARDWKTGSVEWGRFSSWTRPDGQAGGDRSPKTSDL